MTNPRTSSQSLLLAMLLGGCAVGPDYRKPEVPVPAKFSEISVGAAADATGGRWWKSFGDALLVQMIDTAMTANLDVAAAEAKIAESRATRDAMAGGYAPQIEATGRAGRESFSRNGETLANIPVSNPRNTFSTYRVGFDASWEIDLFGHTRRSVEAANARLGASVESRNEARVAVAAEVARNYVEYRTYQQRIVTTRDNVAAFEQTANLVRLQYQAGLASALDLKRAQSDWLASRAALPPLEAEARASVHALGVLLGLAPGALVAELGASAPIPLGPAAVPVGLPSELARRRPDVRRIERELAAATADVGVAVAEQFPRFSLTSALGLDSIRSGDLARLASRYWSVIPQISAPLFEGGRLRSQTEARWAARDAALARYHKGVLEALSDVESALVRIDRQRVRAADLDAAYDASSAALDLSRQRYAAGDTPLTDLLDTERQANTLGDQRVRANGQLALYVVSLYKALGGGWDVAGK